MTNKKQNLIEIARSFNRKVNLGNYETADFFCSYKEETEINKAEEISKRAFIFCRMEVEKDIEEYKKRNEPKPYKETPEEQKKIDDFKEAIKDNIPTTEIKEEIIVPIRQPETFNDGDKNIINE